MDTIYVKAANKSWYHYSVLGKRARRTVTNFPTGLFDHTSVSKEVIAYPNPVQAGQDLWLKSVPGSIQTIRLITMDGKMIRMWHNRTNRISIPVLHEGLYLLHATQTDGKQILNKLWIKP
jgi:hypothetical protein